LFCVAKYSIQFVWHVVFEFTNQPSVS
jgi:hypothetical protein